jgi:serine/threonine protein kinase
VPSEELPASDPSHEAPPSKETPSGVPALSDPLCGRVVGGRWRVLRRLSQGGMGSIYEAQNVSIGKRVALKFIHGWGESPEACLRFQREAEAASAVESAHIVHVFDTGTTDEGQPYLVMELLQGESLGARLRRGPRPSVAEAVQIAAQVLRGLHRAHEAGVIHRDLKPENVFLVRQDDGSILAKILDFGISKFTRGGQAPGLGTITREGTVLGTPYYMSPEQAQALPGLDARSDLFSLGVILFECLAGQLPWSSLVSYEAVVVAICSRDAPDIRLFAPEVPAPLAHVLKKALAREADERFPSARAFLDALEDAVPGLLSSRSLPSLPSLPVLSEPISEPNAGATWTPREPLPPAPSPALSRPLPLWLAGAIVLLASVGAWMVLRPRPAPPSPAVASPAPRPRPEVTMRVEVDPASAMLQVNGRLLEGGILRGEALAEVEILAEAEGFFPLRQRVRIDGRPVLHLALEPRIAPASVTSAVTSASPGTSAIVAENTAPKPSSKAPPSLGKAPPPADPPAGKGGLRLKEKL